jgi:hypothetical protein
MLALRCTARGIAQFCGFCDTMRTMTHDDDDPQRSQLRLVQEAQPSNELTDLQSMLLGAPFAMAGDATLLEADAAKHIPGCFLTVQCDADGCGQVFKLDLLKGGNKQCPGCGAKYTHAVLLCRTDDDEMVADAMVHIAAANGYGLQAPAAAAAANGAAGVAGGEDLDDDDEDLDDDDDEDIDDDDDDGEGGEPE